MGSHSQCTDFAGSAGPKDCATMRSEASSIRIKYMEATCTLVTMPFFSVDRSCHRMDFLVL